MKTKKPNHNADIQNANKGTNGVNSTYAKNQSNRAKQLAQNRQIRKK